MQRNGKHSDALASYQRAIRADGAFFEAYHNLGIVAEQMGDLLKSTAAYETALALDPASASTRFNFALALQRGGFLRDAATELEKLLANTLTTRARTSPSPTCTRKTSSSRRRPARTTCACWSFARSTHRPQTSASGCGRIPESWRKAFSVQWVEGAARRTDY